MKKMICRIFGHDWRYNFSTLPTKRICRRCKKKQALNRKNPIEEKWNLTFEDKEDDKELINKWTKCLW